jgi:ComEC/Rec2-related protein
VGLLLSALAGCRIGFASPPVPPLALAGLCALSILLACAQRRRAAGVWAAHAAVVLLFWFRAVSQEGGAALTFPALLDGADRAYVSLVGRIEDDAEVLRVRGDGGRVWTFPLRTEAIRSAGPWRRVDKSVRVRCLTPRAEPPVLYGQRVLLHGLVSEDPAGRVRKEWVLRVQADGPRMLDENTGSRLRAFCLRGRQACARVLSRGIEDFPDECGLLLALMLGYRQAMPDRLYDIFSRTGSLHIVAISGSHIIIFSGIAIAFIRALGIPRTRWLFYLAPLVVIYTLGTGMAPSALRACLMALVFWSAVLLRRKPDGASALCFAALVLLLVDPGQIGDAGFVLSFTAVAGLILFYPPIHRFLQRRLPEDPFALQPVSAGSAWRRSVKKFLLALVASSVAAWLVTTPLSAWYFNQFSPVALVVNLFVVPLAAVILFTGCLSLIAGLVSGFLVEVLNMANVTFVSAMLGMVGWFERIPGGHCFVAAPPAGGMAVGFALLAGLFFGSRLVRRAAAIGAGIAAIVLLGVRLADQRVEICLPGGDSAGACFIDLPGGRDVLVDPGPRFSSRDLMRWLRARGVDRLGALVVTRARADVAGGAVDLMDRIPVDELWLPDHDARSTVDQRLRDLAAGREIPVRRLARGDRGSWRGVVEWEALHPVRGAGHSNAAEAQLVLRVARGPSSVLFFGERNAAVEAGLSASAQELSASAVLFGNGTKVEDSIFCRNGATCLTPGEDDEQRIVFARSSGWRWPAGEVTVRTVRAR